MVVFTCYDYFLSRKMGKYEESKSFEFDCAG